MQYKTPCAASGVACEEAATYLALELDRSWTEKRHPLDLVVELLALCA
jgi:hypothetical protein